MNTKVLIAKDSVSTGRAPKITLKFHKCEIVNEAILYSPVKMNLDWSLIQFQIHRGVRNSVENKPASVALHEKRSEVMDAGAAALTGKPFDSPDLIIAIEKNPAGWWT